MIIKSDFHIHSEASYDATLTLSEIYGGAGSFGFEAIGITDHLNLNDKSFMQDIRLSAKNVHEFNGDKPKVILGVELTPIAMPEFEYISIHGSGEGYVAPVCDTPYGIELAATKEELMALGIRYAVGASHWRVDIPGGKLTSSDLNECIKEWYRQQMWLACDERVTILGHPWYHGEGLWYKDFSVIPKSMNADIAAALKENGKYAECNSQFFNSKFSTEKFRHQYAELLREMFEMGIPITYGSDSHGEYRPDHLIAEKYLEAAGFKAGDFSTLNENNLWH